MTTRERALDDLDYLLSELSRHGGQYIDTDQVDAIRLYLGESTQRMSIETVALDEYEKLWMMDEESGHGYIDTDLAAHWCERYGETIRAALMRPSVGWMPIETCPDGYKLPDGWTAAAWDPYKFHLVSLPAAPKEGDA